VQQEQLIFFPPFRLDPIDERLWQGSREISLRPKTFTVLRCMLEHPGRLITKESLLDSVWHGTHVSDVVLRSCIQEIREALRDDPAAPKFIETVHRRGYRFIAPLSTQLVRSSESGVRSQQNFQLTPNPQHPAPTLVGREEELRQLYRWLDKTLNGERQTIFITGEPGVGKTTVMEAFLKGVPSQESFWIGYGQCLAHYGAGEAYMPVLEALGRLCRGPGGGHIIEVLDRYAPTWLLQMPSLLDVDELNAIQQKTQGTSQERMLRELAEAVEALTAERPLVLVLEDLHWADYSTLDLISALARRREPVRLLVIGTYRPMDISASGYPLKAIKQELQLHECCEEMPLEFLTEAAVAEYLLMRFRGSSLPDGLARLIHQRTDGNSLFMVNVVDYLVAQGLIIQADGHWKLRVEIAQLGMRVPESLRQMIEKQIDGLTVEEQRVLETASVAGVEFSAAAVAAGLGKEVEEIEEACSGLARRGHFLRPEAGGEWPDGTVAARYSFIHQLYQEVLQERVTVGRRARLHRLIGEREETAYGDRAGEIAGELAIHFEAGRDYRRAVRYLGQAAEIVLGRHANREAIGYLDKGLELLKLRPDTPEYVQQELTLQTLLGPALIAVKGYAATEVGAAYTRAHDLCQRIAEPPELLRVLRGLWVFHYMRAELLTAKRLGEQLLTLAQVEQNPALSLEAHYALAATLTCVGDISTAYKHAKQGIALYDPQQHRSHVFLYGQDPGVYCQLWAAVDLWFLGYPDQSLQRSQAMLALAHDAAHPFSLTTALFTAAILHQLRRESQATQERTVAAIALTNEQGFAFWPAWGAILQGWALTVQGQEKEGIAKMHQGRSALQAMQASWLQSYHLALLAKAYGKAGQTEEGLRILTGALAEGEETRQHFYDAELYRIKGQLVLQSGVRSQNRSRQVRSPRSEVTNPQSLTPNPHAQAEAEACFLKALEIAREQQAKSLELRAVMSLSRLWQRQGKKEEAYELLTEVYNWFTEGFETKDLREAATLLRELR